MKLSLVFLFLASFAWANPTFQCKGNASSKEDIIIDIKNNTAEVYAVNKSGHRTGFNMSFSGLKFEKNGMYEVVKGYAFRNPVFPTYAESMSVIARPYNEMSLSVGPGSLPSTLELLVRGLSGTAPSINKYTVECP